MLRGTRIPVFVAAFIIHGQGSQLRADVRLVFREADSAGAQYLTIIIQGDRAAFLRGNPGQEAVEVIYNRPRQSLLFINHQERHYTLLSRAWAKEMRKRIEETSRRLADDIKKQSASLPPDLRPYYLPAQTFSPWMGMLSQSANAPGTGQPRQFLSLAGTRKLGNYRCRPAELRQAEKKLMELCLSDPGTVGIPESDMETWHAMQVDVFELQKLGAFMFGFHPPDLLRTGPEAEGFPIQLRNVAANGPLTTLDTANNAPVDPVVFEPPPDYLEAVIPLPGALF